MDSTLTIIAATGLGLALAAGVVAHTRADDARREDLAACVDGWEESAALNAMCLAVADECRALVEGHACSCWRVSE